MHYSTVSSKLLLTPQPVGPRLSDRLLDPGEPTSIRDSKNHLDNDTNGCDLTNNGEQLQNLKLPRMFMLTSFDESGVQRNAVAHAEYLKTMRRPEKFNESAFLDDLAHTLALRRSIFPWRSHVLANSVSQLIEKFEQFSVKPIRALPRLDLGFVFTGQGAQWHAMGRELMTYTAYRKSLEDASDYLMSIGAPWSLTKELSCDKDNSNINQPYLAHPSCTAIQMALVDLLASWGVKPTRVIGHSSGEIAAAYCAGRLTREAAWRTAYFRGHVSSLQFKSNGAMLAVGLSESELHPYLKRIHERLPGEVSIRNTPR